MEEKNSELQLAQLFGCQGYFIDRVPQLSALGDRFLNVISVQETSGGIRLPNHSIPCPCLPSFLVAHHLGRGPSSLAGG